MAGAGGREFPLHFPVAFQGKFFLPVYPHHGAGLAVYSGCGNKFWSYNGHIGAQGHGINALHGLGKRNPVFFQGNVPKGIATIAYGKHFPLGGNQNIGPVTKEFFLQAFPHSLGNLVQPSHGSNAKGKYSYKQQGAQYENFGNFNYGMTAAAAGIPEQVALRAAGWAQERAGTSRDEWGNPTDLGGSYGDDPADQQQIRDGYAYHESGLWRVWGG